MASTSKVKKKSKKHKRFDADYEEDELMFDMHMDFEEEDVIAVAFSFFLLPSFYDGFFFKPVTHAPLSLSSRSFFLLPSFYDGFFFKPHAKKGSVQLQGRSSSFHVVDCKNPGRKFHGCPNFKDKAKDCKYFRWVDEEPTIKTYKDLLVKMHSDMKDMEDA
ncbi:hypothetical protein LXL04_029266 [Taraxacum kok-saghyz]